MQVQEEVQVYRRNGETPSLFLWGKHTYIHTKERGEETIALSIAIPLWHDVQGDEVANWSRWNQALPGLFLRRKVAYIRPNEGPKETIGGRSAVRLQLMFLWRFSIFQGIGAYLLNQASP
jgi:hypothetical protein